MENLRNILFKFGYPPLLQKYEADPLSSPVTQRHDPIFKLICDTIKPRNIVEFGTWEGRSAITWLSNTPQDATIVCVDTFLGSWEHFLDVNPESEFGSSHLSFELGHPTLYQRFLQNIESYRFTDRVVPICNTTQNAYEILKRLNLNFDVVYVDAAHDYIPVMLDLEYAIQLVSKPQIKDGQLNDEMTGLGGVILGDDFLTWESVASAVKDFCAESQLRLFEGSNNWVITDFLSDPVRLLLEENLLANGYTFTSHINEKFESRIWEKARTQELLQLQSEHQELLNLRSDQIELRNLRIERDKFSYELDLIKSSNFYRRYALFVKLAERLKLLRQK